MLNLRLTLVLVFVSFNLVNPKPLVDNSDKGTCELGECSNVESPFKPSKKEICDLCYVLMPLLRLYLEQTKTERFDPAVVAFLCKELKLTDPVVCKFSAK